MSASIDVRAITEADIPSFSEVLKSVIAERRYLAATSPPMPKQIRDFVSRNIDMGYPQVVATAAERIIGWCDIVPLTPAECAHVARLGMGLHADYRGQGIGQRLISKCLADACNFGFEKVELDVYNDNHNAIKLYSANHFVVEGTRRRSRKLEGQYQDIIIMSKFLNGSP